MAVAKRQRREKPMKTTQEGPRNSGRTSGKTNSLQANPVYIGQALGEKNTYKKRSQNEASGFSSLPVFWMASYHASRLYFPLLAK